MRIFSFVFITALLWNVTDAQVQSLADGLTTGEAGRVVEVIDGDTVLLESGLEVRLVGIQAPKLPLGRRGFAPWPLADEAKTALEELVLGRAVTLHYGGRRVDRYGRALAHLVRDDGQWIQARLLELGLARVYSFADNRALIADMLRVETNARQAARAMWSLANYQVLGQAEAARGEGDYALVEGWVVDVAEVRGRGFLNFGADYRTDFTISIDPPDLREFFEKEDVLLESYNGARVRVRGWVEDFNGPMIRVTHPEQIEILTPAPAN